MTGTSIHKDYFGSGPATLPAEVLMEAAEAVKAYKSSGLSILEIPHRGPLFADILDESRELVRELCSLSPDQEVLWMQGGGRLQFCMIPMNFLPSDGKAGYIDSGHWAHSASESAAYYGDVVNLASSADIGYSALPEWPSTVPQDLSYLHFTTNNTIYGTQWRDVPHSQVPLIADMSSDILSCHRDYSDYGLFYACAQKNIGPTGVTLVVIKNSMLDRKARRLPAMLDYSAHISQGSLLNTPPVFAIYTSLLMLRWTKQKTIAVLERESLEKSELLYQEIERNSLFSPSVTVKEHRSRMNICFRGSSSEVEEGFKIHCAANNITGLEGHRTAGGFRASLYNGVSVSSVRHLVATMQEYEHQHHKQSHKIHS